MHAVARGLSAKTWAVLKGGVRPPVEEQSLRDGFLVLCVGTSGRLSRGTREAGGGGWGCTRQEALQVPGGSLVLPAGSVPIAHLCLLILALSTWGGCE